MAKIERVLKTRVSLERFTFHIRWLGPLQAVRQLGNTPRCQRQFLAAPAPSGSELELVGPSRTTVLSSYTAETGVHTRHGHLSQKWKHGKRIVKDSNSKTRCHGVLFWYSYPSSGSFPDGLLTWQSDRGDCTAHRRPPQLEIDLGYDCKGATWWPVGGGTLC